MSELPDDVGAPGLGESQRGLPGGGLTREAWMPDGDHSCTYRIPLGE